MAERKTFPLRLDPALYRALQRWAGADLRSLNAQIEFLLRKALREAGRLPVNEGGDEGGEERGEGGKARQETPETARREGHEKGR